MSQRVLVLPDGEEIAYEESDKGLKGPCPGCFMKSRLRSSVEEAVKKTTMELRWFGWDRIVHLGCGTWVIVGDSWVPE